MSDYKILSLDGGGSKGVYTLGILKELEALQKSPIHQNFDLIYGTSTGAIIAAGLAFGMTSDELFKFYSEEVSSIMKKFRRSSRSKALETALKSVFKDKTFNSTLTGLAIVATNDIAKRPFIFKSNTNAAHGMKGSFVPGFGVPVADAVQASCSAFPFFEKKMVSPTNQQPLRLLDGGFCANNPAILAYADATGSLGIEKSNLKILSLGTGNYPERYPIYSWLQGIRIRPSLELISTQFSSSSNSIEKIFEIISKDCHVVRVNDSFTEPSLATSLFESDAKRLDMLKNKGRDSFGAKESSIKNLLGIP